MFTENVKKFKHLPILISDNQTILEIPAAYRILNGLEGLFLLSDSDSS